MDRKEIFDTILKNRILILCCAMLIFGALFGICVLKILPETVCKNLFLFLSQKNENFINLFLNGFCFPATVLTAIYLSGFGLFGRFTALSALFINGVFYAFENGINYMFFGIGFFTKSMVTYFTSTLFIGFMLIIMAENAFYSSRLLSIIVEYNNAEKPHFKAKNLNIKYFTFTIVFALFSAFSAYISVILQKIL
ncbi:MAG: hypothetical protein IKU42_02695 [Oscillospiraceae bacterium]|nr:hypothetical protein [Oscillospiraceae bacterium]